MRRRLALLGFLTALVAGAPGAAAQSCGSEIYRMAWQYDLTLGAPLLTLATDVPATPTRPSARSLGEILARSGGVIVPPDRDPAIQRLPRGTGDRLALAPPMPLPWHADLRAPSPEMRARMTALLLAARAAERQGSEAECFAILRAAIATPPGAR